jgi:hypothetical protein
VNNLVFIAFHYPRYAMVKQVLTLVLAAGMAFAQTPADQERRIAELEKKIQSLEAKRCWPARFPSRRPWLRLRRRRLRRRSAG